MAREAYRSLYGDLTKLKGDSLLKDPAAGAGDDDEMFQLLLSVSDWVDHFCNRHFYSRQQTLEFDGDGTTKLLVPDLIAVDSIKEDTTDDKTFDTTWAVNDYWLEPYNAEPTEYWGRPYTSIRVRQHGNQDVFTKGDSTSK